MKKVFLIIISLVCAVSVFAVSYATPYKGSGRSGGIYLSSAAHRSAASMGMVQAPVATMSSTSSINTGVRGVNVTRTMTVAMPAANSVRGIYTAASAVTGGVTTYSHPHPGHVRKGPDTPGEVDDTPPECGCHWELIDDKYVCPICGCVWDGLSDACDCVEESGYCWCPLDMDWSVLAFLSLLSFAYIAYKKRQKMSNFVKTVF